MRCRVRTHAVAIQLVELSAFRSLPILAYCIVSRVSLVPTDLGRKKRPRARIEVIHLYDFKHRDMVENYKSNTYCRHGEELVEGAQEDANAYSRQQDVQPLGHLGNAFPRHLVAAISRWEGLTASLNGSLR